MKKDKMSNEIQSLQNNSDYAIVDNVFSNPKFVRKISINKTKAINEIYTPKLFIEIVSRLKPENLEHLKNNENLVLDLNIKEFLKNIEVSEKHGYGYLVDVIDMLQTTQLKWTEDKKDISTTIISKYTHEKGSGKIDLYVDSELAKRLLSVKSVENFSFLKENFFKLKTSQAIKLYQFFKSWQNKGVYQTDLLRFKEQFGYNTSGYNDFNKFKNRVLEPAKAEINEKTDIIVNYQTTGDNLESLRPRVKGLIFTIKAKGKDTKQLPNGERHQTPQPQDEQTHILNIIPQVIPTQQKEHKTTHNQPSQAEIIELGEKAKLTTPQIEKIQELYRTNIRTWEAIKAYLTAPNKATIQNQFAYIIDHKSVNTLGVGIWEAEKEKIIKRQKQAEEQHQTQLHEAIKKEYKDRKELKFEEFYKQATEKEKAELFEIIKNNPKNYAGEKNFKINAKGELNGYGEQEAGAILAEKRNYGLEIRQNEFREEMFKRFNVLVSYDENDLVLIIPNLFQEQKPIEQEPQEQSPLLPHSPKKEIKNEFSEKEKIQNLKIYEAKKRQPKKIEDKKPTKAPTEREAKQPEPQEPAEPMATASQPTEQEQTTETPIIQHTSQANNSNDEPLHIGNLLERTFSKFFKK